MPKRVLDIGNCDPDHAAIRRMIEGTFDAHVDRAGVAGRGNGVAPGHYDLVLVNRKLDIDYSDGLTIIERIKADAELGAVPVMMITNYADHQKAAVGAGDLSGFGKLETRCSGNARTAGRGIGFAGRPAIARAGRGGRFTSVRLA